MHREGTSVHGCRWMGAGGVDVDVDVVGLRGWWRWVLGLLGCGCMERWTWEVIFEAVGSWRVSSCW